MESLVLFYPDGHQKHYIPGHPECPERVEAIKEGLEQIGIWEKYSHLSPLPVNHELLTRVHAPDYLVLLERTKLKAQMLDMDTYATRDTWRLAVNAAGGALAVADWVWDRKAETGFALTRPPGHHATRNRAMGFCLINNIAVASEYLLSEKGASRLAIVDLDLHHGNGTQEIFWERADVSYISIHQAPFYPGTGYLSEVGENAGKNSTLNLPIPAYSGDLAYQTLLEEVILPYLNIHQPEMLLVSFGFDTHWRDPLGSMQVSGGGIYQLFQTLRLWSTRHCSGKLAVLLEGGYDLDAASVCGQAVSAALTDLPWQDDLGPSPHEESEEWKATLRDAVEMLGI
ncbi:MAG: histone deacetylase [Anaerolineales bacterium]|jgi:acetoin utilization deacetylase AcuC-like enzyme